MTIQAWLQQATQTLKASGIESARLDCLILLEDILNKNRTQILAHPEQEITEVDNSKLAAMVAKRAQHVPLAYLRNKAEFYGYTFTITPTVLVPRPESEAIIDLLKQIGPIPNTIIDVGTGSGALACIAKIELPDAKVIALDIDKQCLALARKNATTHLLDITFYQSDLLNAVPLDELDRNQTTTLLCNLPYVPNDYPINQAATHEPALALFGGPDGLDLYKSLFDQANEHASITHIVCESLVSQHEELTKVAQTYGWSLSQTQGLAQDFIRTTR